MPAGSTYTPIATTTLGSAASSYTFSSIPSTYTDLVLICNYATSLDATDAVYIQFNSDSGSNYSSTDLIGDGSSATSGRTSSASYVRIGGRAVGTSSAFSNVSTTSIQNYSNSTTYKTLLNRYGSASRATVATAGLWRNTAAITSLTVAANGQTLSTGSTFTLYGIASA